MKQSTAKPVHVATQLLSLDLGDRSSRYCVFGADKELAAQGSVATTRQDLQRLFAQYSPVEVSMEVGGHSPWVSRLVESLGMRATVANSRKLDLITRNDRKNDRTDAELVGRLTLADRKLLSPIRHRSEQSQIDLAVMRSRIALVSMRTALINHVRGQVKSLGYRLASSSARSFHKRVPEDLPKDLRPALLPVAAMIEQVTGAIQRLEREIATIARERYPHTEVLRQVPGVGSMISLQFVLTLDDPGRVKNSRQVGAYLGLVPRTQDSGDSSPQLSITKAGDSEMRRLLVNGANYILGNFGPDCDLKRFGLKIAARGGKNARRRAKVAVARKLAVLLHRLWKTGEEYDPFHVARRRGESVPA